MEYSRRAGDEPVPVACETDGTQVVVLFHRVALAVETDIVNLAILNHCLVARSLCVETVVGIVGAEVHPVVVRLVELFVLEFYVVETIRMDIESVNHYGQIVAGTVVRRLCVEYPLVVRCGQVECGGCRYEMNGDCGFVTLFNVANGAQPDTDILEVVSLTAFHLQYFVNCFAMRYGNLHRGEAQCYTVDR